MLNAARCLFDREVGAGGFREWRSRVVASQRQELVLLESGQPDTQAVQSTVQSLRCERYQDRYTLLGCGDGSIFVYDMEGVQDGKQAAPVAHASRNAATHHGKGVCVADWYANDFGVFSVGSFDGTVGVWDTNAMQCEHLYHVSDCVNSIASGVWGMTAPLIACATRKDHLRLLDMRQEANTHTLMGHRDQVISLAWSNADPHQLVSGDIEGSVFVWDVRKPIPMSEIGSKKAPQVIGAMTRSDSGASSLAKKAKLSSSASSSLDREVDAIVRRSAGVVKKAESSAHEGSVNAMCFASSGQYLITCSLAERGNNVKVCAWDLLSNECVAQSFFARSFRSSVAVPLLRFDMCAMEDVYMCEEPIFLCVSESLYSFRPVQNRMEHRPSGHVRGPACVAYNRRLQNLYSAGYDGMFHVWSWPCDAALEENEIIVPEEQDEW